MHFRDNSLALRTRRSGAPMRVGEPPEDAGEETGIAAGGFHCAQAMFPRALRDPWMRSEHRQLRDQRAAGRTDGRDEIVDAFARRQRQRVRAAFPHRLDEPFGTGLRRNTPVAGHVIDGCAARTR